MNRAFLELVAAAVNVTAANYPNDSKLEQAVRYKLETMTALAGTATTQAPSASAVQRAGGYAKNI